MSYDDPAAYRGAPRPRNPLTTERPRGGAKKSRRLPCSGTRQSSVAFGPAEFWRIQLRPGNLGTPGRLDRALRGPPARGAVGLTSFDPPYGLRCPPIGVAEHRPPQFNCAARLRNSR